MNYKRLIFIGCFKIAYKPYNKNHLMESMSSNDNIFN